MRKTTVYLPDEDAEGLRRLSQSTGDSQAELVREGVRRVLRRRAKRTFRSMGAGEGSGETEAGWDSDELHEKAFGKR